MMVALPFLGFGQSAAKNSIHPLKQKSSKVAASLGGTSYAPNAYCIPTALDCTDGDVMTNVTFGTINNTTTCGTNGYNDFSAMATNVTPGTAMPMSVTVGSGWFERVSVWVDLNNNQIFEDSERLSNNVGPLGTSGNNGDMGLGGGIGTGGALTGNITIPAGTAAGSYKMRVMVIATGSGNPAPSDPCLDIQFGEVEDYTLTVPATGCLTSPNGQYPSATFTPACNGTTENVTTLGWTGEYSKVSLTGGVAYTFSSSVASHFITISDEAGTTTLAAGTGPVVYTPSTSRIVRFYTHLSSNCDFANTSHTRAVMCGTPPTNCADFKVLSNNLENGLFFGGSTSQKLAIDVPVAASNVTVYGLEPTVVGTATTFSFTFYSDNAGLPGAQLFTRTGTITESTVTGTNFGYEFIKYKVMFNTPVDFSANTKYWIEVTTDAVAWEARTGGTLGSLDAFSNTSTSGVWTTGTNNLVFNLVCSPLAVSDIAKSGFNYYPNPVKGYLNIDSKQKVEMVHVYNVAGQKMPVSTQLVDGKIDMSRLAPGVYIVSTILEGGRNESFKVVKQ
ncbi:hypothetical protein ACM44_02330 [Chryseobacterium koreense CCUG 49689]|uniref:Uncharacterized protein n=2 Tax=Chryseobacterium koreense TaxID=232216 RepID=A0A0J7J2N5_9FLAO|nr:hypothetical protein ACM44_02330 [Chryseobacterium koreense CCUG 49689]